MLLLCLTITQAAAEDEATVTLPARAVRAMIEENIQLRKEVNKLDEANDELFRKWKHRVDQRGECT